MMVSTILLILKVLLIALLSIIGFVLFVVLLVLLWPFAYKFRVNKETGINISFNLSFFFHLISVWAIYDKGFNIKAKILGITLFDKNKRKAKSDADELDDLDSFDELDLSESDSELNNKNNYIDNDNEDNKASDINTEIVEVDTVKDTEDKQLFDTNNEDITTDINSFDKKAETGNSANTESNTESNKEYKEGTNTDTESEIEKKSLFDRIEDFIASIMEKIESLFDKIVSFAENISENTEEKIDKISDTIVYYDKLLNSKGTEKVLEFLKKKIIQILKSIRPRKGRVTIKYGSDDPSKVGKMYELYSLLSPFLPKKSRFYADFEQNIFECDLWLKGRLFIGYLGIIALQLIFNKKLKKFIKLLKREER